MQDSVSVSLLSEQERKKIVGFHFRDKLWRLLGFRRYILGR